MRTCPFCHRHLLSQASARCNWCGREIPDADYQKQAEAKREAFFAEQAIHDAVSLARMEAVNVNPLLAPLDPLTGLPLVPRPARAPRPLPPAFGRPYRAPRTPPAAEAAPTPEATPDEKEDTTGGRFRHLEL